MSSTTDYGLSKQVNLGQVPAPELPYLPRVPRHYRPKIGVVGAGGVTEYHLRAYQKMGLDVAMICDLNLKRAKARRDEFFPQASVCSNLAEVLRREDIAVIDAALHPEPRVPLIEAAIRSGKHILSQKPFALDLDVAERLADLADSRGVKLAVNQNGRWAPHFAYAREAVRAGLLGEIGSVDFHLAFDHSWTIGTPFEDIHHLLLFDFGVHWFDMVSCFLEGRQLVSVSASVGRSSYQKARPPFLASVIIDAEDAQARMAFNAAVTYGQADRTQLAGSRGTLQSIGPSLSQQQVTVTTAAGEASPDLKGTWFESGFQGTMGELLCAIEENREPLNSARNNLRTLALCFAALESADKHRPVRPGEVRRMPGTTGDLT
ncbi:MAG TPA: Gfo/Idh/MocA family oxidoreductase [Candidatus Limnocylindrales bacterium]|nr:Gfo/Idh/MocA family oxidoreductase [Candidatus Limnocylindrales bacterium]